MDDETREMVVEAYGETVADAVKAGRTADIAHKEGITAAAMLLAAVNGLEDAAARSAVEGLGLKTG